MKYIISYDLGTGGTKASLFDENGVSLVSSFISTQTYYPQSGFHEQKPEDWWISVCESTKNMLAKTTVNPEDIAALAVSGHSLGVVPISAAGELLEEYVPIWSDSRAGKEAAEFFKTIDEEQWYLTTGNGFPAPLYSVFKLMWYKTNRPATYKNAVKFIGTKDYVNFKMTGILCTDHSYASGLGVYSLTEEKYVDTFIEASGISAEKFPEIRYSTDILGTVNPEIAAELGISVKTKVACGGVDNACMAVGAGCVGEGETYTSLGSSAWIAVSSAKPVVSTDKRPYVFAHCVPHHFVSSTAIFSAGNSYRWIRNTFCQDFVNAEANGGIDSYEAMNKLAAESPIGSRKLIFNPTLAGGSSLDKTPNIRGAFVGLDLLHSRSDVIRATMEGVCLNLRIALDVLGRFVHLSENMLIVGGGGKSQFWRKIFADTYNKNIVETNVGQDAGSLGAAAVAAIGVGLWQDFEKVKEIHQVKNVIAPDSGSVKIYEKMLPLFIEIADMQCEIGDKLAKL